MELSARTKVITPPGQWHYAALIPLQSSALSAADLAADPVIVRMRAEVLSGRVGFGALAKDGSTFLAETVMGSEQGPGVIDLLFGPLSSCASLVIRNASDQGSSEAAIWSARVYRGNIPAPPASPAALDPPSEMAPGPMANWERYYGHTFTALETQIRARQLAQLDRPRPMRWLWGLQVMVDRVTEIGRAMYLSGRYEPSTMHVVQRLLSDGACFFDVGANVGIFSLAGAVAVGSTGRVVAFEPSSREFNLLRKNIELNHLDQVITLQQAVADVPGRADLRVAEALHSGHNTLGAGFAYAGVVVEAVEEVQVTTIDEWVRKGSPPRVDVLKMDIEGAELRALRGARDTLSRFRPVIVVELLDLALRRCGASADEVRGLLAQSGYTLWQIDDATGRLAPLDGSHATQSANVVAIPAERATQVIERVNA